MNINEAISHCDEIIKKTKCEENTKCKIEHIQLKEWLIRLRYYDSLKNAIIINGKKYELIEVDKSKEDNSVLCDKCDLSYECELLYSGYQLCWLFDVEGIFRIKNK